MITEWWTIRSIAAAVAIGLWKISSHWLNTMLLVITIERYHRTMKNVVKLENYFFPWELEAALRDFVAYCNHERYHELLDNVTPADVYFGRQYAVLSERAKIKRRTMQRRKREYLAGKAA